MLLFFISTATTEIYTLSLHDALPILIRNAGAVHLARPSIFMRSRPSRSRSEEHTSELQSPDHLVCRLLLEKKNRRVTKMMQIDELDRTTTRYEKPIQFEAERQKQIRI